MSDECQCHERDETKNAKQAFERTMNKCSFTLIKQLEIDVLYKVDNVSHDIHHQLFYFFMLKSFTVC